MPDLHQALDESLAFAAHYPVGGMQLSNHLPMVLTALWRLGAPADALSATLARMGPRLVPVAAGSAEARAAAGFADALHRDGLAPTLAVHLPGLLLAAETAAFHGLIRLAHALDAQHPGEIARALAAWQTSRLSLGPVLDAPLSNGQPSIATAIDRLQGRADLAFEPRQGTTITSDLQACVALAGFEAASHGADAPSDQALGIDPLAEASLAVYLASRDFTALHLVTACHAWRQVEPLAGLGAAQARAARRGLWRAWLAAWLSIGRPAPDWAAVRQGSASEAAWQAALPQIATSRDDHRIKLAWTALDEWWLRGWPGYARVVETRA
ncbi:MAG: questin oxidase family protein [Burkholderiaceae bacterium]